DALRVCVDGRILSLYHLREVQRHTADGEAVLLGVHPRELIVLRRLEQRLGRNASDVDASSAERFVALDAHGLESELRRADRGDVTARPSADYEDVRGQQCVVCHVTIGNEAVRPAAIDRQLSSDVAAVAVQSINIDAGSSISSFTRTRKSTAC